MRWFVYPLGACLALWVGSFVTRTGVLVFDDLYMMSDADGIDFDPTTGATEPPVGRLCYYLTYAGPWQFALIDRDQWDHIIQARNGSADPELADYRLVDEWGDSACPVFHSFPR
jgi:hypothetical protein